MLFFLFTYINNYTTCQVVDKINIMKNILKLLGIIVFVTIIGFTMTACGDGNGSGGKIPAELAAKWYLSQAAADAGGADYSFEITSAGKYQGGGSDTWQDVSVNGNTITFSVAGHKISVASFSVSGTILTVSRESFGNFSPGLYYKKAN